MTTWTLTPEAFHKLLGFLDPDPELAAQAYEQVRHKLIRLFQWRGCRDPEDLVDETINRVARKIDEGEEIRTEDPYRYFSGVARLVFHETIRKEKRARLALEKESWPPPQAPEDEQEEHQALLDCLQGAIAELPEQNQRLILVYYEGEKGVKIRNRKRLAEDLGIPMNALRIRAHRIRLKLEASVERCVEAFRGRAAGEGP